MPHLYFVRHGQTIWNVENKICGSTDIALTPLGHEQAIAAGKLLHPVQWIHICRNSVPVTVALQTLASRSLLQCVLPYRLLASKANTEWHQWDTAALKSAFSRQKRSLRTITRVENPCCSWHSGFIIFWMNSCSRKRIICWLHTMALLGSCGRIFRI